MKVVIPERENDPAPDALAVCRDINVLCPVWEDARKTLCLNILSQFYCKIVIFMVKFTQETKVPRRERRLRRFVTAAGEKGCSPSRPVYVSVPHTQ